MNIEENLGITGNVTIKHTDMFGNVKNEFTVKNIVTTVGKNHIAAKIAATTNSPVSMTHMALGTSSTTQVVGDTTLGAELSPRVALTSTTVTTNSIAYVATFSAGIDTGAITEAGIFNASTVGTLLCRTVFPTVTKLIGDAVVVSWTLTIS